MSNTIEHVNPADVGLSGNTILKYVENLQASGSEMHGLMIARHGKVCAEGWWKPYSPQLIHGLQSLTKSYVATAIGILIDEGRASLDEKIVDIFPEYMPDNKSDNLKALTIHRLLCMGAGNNSMQDRTKRNWLYDFFASDFPYPPGSRFYYSGVVTSVVGAVIRQKTSIGLMDYLKSRLFNKIGIDAERLKWIELPDGLEYGGGGLFATTEDDLRLGQLYLNGGMWQGERILSEEWVKAATSKQIDTKPIDTKQIDTDRKLPADHSVGYGYQMWMCQPAGVYRFDGAQGQYVIVIPYLDMVIAINQTAYGPIAQKTLDITWQYLIEAQGSDVGDIKLATLMPSLSLPRIECGGIPRQDRFTKDRIFKFNQNNIGLLPDVYDILSYKIPKGIEQITFSEKRGEILTEIRCSNSFYTFHISLDGVDRLSIAHVADDLPEMAYASAVWMDDDTLKITLRYLETCFTVSYLIKRHPQGIELTAFRWMPTEGKPPESIKICSVNN